MNWFERYGIVGIYFLTISFLWLICLSSGSVTNLMKEKEIADVLIALLGFSLPLGYILSILSMRIYYSNSTISRWLHLRRSIHVEIVKKMNNNAKGFEYLSEHLLEARMTSLIRLRKIEEIKLNDSKDLQYLGMFCTRRFDVLAINRAIMLSTVLSFLLVFVSVPFLFSIKIAMNRLISLSIASIIIYLILASCNKILEEQIIEINTFNFFPSV